jgi:hypothetical protein
MSGVALHIGNRVANEIKGDVRRSSYEIGERV